DLTRQTYGHGWFDKSMICHRIFEYSDLTESKCPSLICGILSRQFCWKMVVEEKGNLNKISHNANGRIVKKNNRFFVLKERRKAGSIKFGIRFCDSWVR